MQKKGVIIICLIASLFIGVSASASWWSDLFSKNQADETYGLRTDSAWNDRTTYIETAFSTGRNILINGTSKYINFNTTSGSTGYGLRDNAGAMEFKNSGGSWAGIGSGSGLYDPLGQATSTKDWLLGQSNTWTGTNTFATTTISNLNGVIVVDGVKYAKTASGLQLAENDCYNLSKAGLCSGVDLGISTILVGASTTISMYGNINFIGHGTSSQIVFLADGKLLWNNQSNFKVTGVFFNATSTYSGSSPVQVLNGSNWELSGNTVWANGFGFYLGPNGSNTTSNCVVSNNTMYGHGNNDVIGGGPQNSTGAVMKNCSFNNNYIVQDITYPDSDGYATAIDIVASKYNEFIGNHLYGSLYLGNEQSPNEYNIISENFIYPAIGATYGEIVVAAASDLTNSQINNQIINNNIYIGRIYLYGLSGSVSYRNLISGNQIFANGIPQEGIFLSYSSQSIISNNVIKGTGKCLQLSHLDTANVYGNNFSNCIYGIVETTTGGNWIHDNQFINISYKDVDARDPLSIYFNNISTATTTIMNSENSTINMKGNFGIGTTSPYAKLSVELSDITGTIIGSDVLTGFTGNLLDMKVASSSKFIIDYDGKITTGIWNSTAIGIGYGGTGQTSFGQGWLGINNSGEFISSSSPNVAWIIATSTTATSTFNGGMSVAGISGLTILQNGKVGIGTTSPASSLQIIGNSTINDYMQFTIGLLSTPKRGLTLGYDSSTNISHIYSRFSGVGVSPLSLNNGQLYITGTGNVGIGTTTPAVSLDVNGYIKANQTSTTTACSANLMGSMFYNQANDKFWGCGSGSAWQQLSGSGGGGYSSLADLQAAVSNDFHNLGGVDSTGSGGAGTVSTSTTPVIGNLAYWTGTGWPSTLGTVATTSLTASSPLSLSQAISVIGGSASALSLDTSGTWTGVAGTASALAADPTDCGSNTWATTIGANGNLTCSAITYAGITAMTSANFAGLISDETGSGKVVFDTSPTLITPILGFASSTAITASYASSTTAFFGTAALPNLGTPAGTFLAVNASGQIIATTSPSGGNVIDTLASTLGAGNDAGGLNMENIGKVGIATTTKTWDLATGIMELGAGSLWSYSDTSLYISTNEYYNTASLHKSTGASNRIVMDDGVFSLQDAASNTAGSANIWDTNLIILANGDVGIGTSNPSYKLTVNGNIGTNGIIYATSTVISTSLQIPNGASGFTNTTGQMFIDTTSGQFRYNNGAATSTLTGFYTMVAGHATSTWSGTTTLYMAPAMAAGTVEGAYCETNIGTVAVSLYDGTNRADYIPTASTTINYFKFSTNNTFTAGESMRVDFGSPASTPGKVSCRFKFLYSPD